MIVATRSYESNGQYLAWYIDQKYLGGSECVWKSLTKVLKPSARSEDWVEAFQQMVVLQLVRRLITAGRVLLESEEDIVAERGIKQMIVETMDVDWSAASAIYERLLPAVRSSRQKLKRGVRREVVAYANREMPFCYLCGRDLSFTADGPSPVTVDHIWPRAYGGGSSLDNLLAACKDCNETKNDVPAWPMYPVQSLIAPGDLDEERTLSRTMRLVVQTRAAQTVAEKKGLSLRDAFICLGRPKMPRWLYGPTTVDVLGLKL